MKTRTGFLVVCTCLFLLAAYGQVPKWKLDVGEQINDYNFLQEGKFLFLTNYEYSWLFDAATGARMYELRVKNWEKKGVHQLIGEKFLIGTSDNLQCYDALTGKLIWKQEYAKVDQDEFTSLSFRNNNVILAFGKVHIGVDLATGKELFRMNIKYNGKLVDKGTWNWSSLEKQNKLMVLMDDDNLGLFTYDDGKQVFEGKDYEVSMKVVEKKYDWCYKSPDQQYMVFLLDESVAVVDVSQNKEIVRKEISYDTDFEPLLSTNLGCAILGKKQIMFFNDSTGTLVEVPASVGDFRTYKVMHVGDKDIFFAGLQDAMFAIDLAAGKLLWESKKEDPNFEGYPHQYLSTDGGNILMTYTSGSGKGGTKLFLESVDALTGKVNYRSNCIFNSKIYMANFLRSIGKFMMEKIAKREHSFGYENIYFDYTVTPLDGNLVFSTVSTAKMINPETTDEGGEGVVIVDPKTGNFIFKDYVKLTDYSWQTDKLQLVPEVKPIVVGTNIFLVGDESIAAYDLGAKKQLFYSKETLKGIPRDAMALDGTLYIKFGEYRYHVKLDPPKSIFGTLGMETKKRWDKDPYGFAAYEIATGKQLWRIETKVDPGFLTPNFSLENNYDASARRLYFADEKNIYALQMKPDGGKYDYTVNLDKSGIGEMPFDDTYAIQEWPVGSVSTSTTYGYGYSVTTTSTSIGGEEYGKFMSSAEEADAYCQYKGWGSTIWGATAKKTLRAVYAGSHIFVIGKEAISLLNAADGKVVWQYKWDYDPKSVQYIPKIMNSKLIFCLDRQLTCLDMEKGEMLWKNKEAKRPIFFNAPNEKFLYVIDEETIRGYELEKQP